jgi:hypothetical protein
VTVTARNLSVTAFFEYLRQGWGVDGPSGRGEEI